MLDFTEIKLIFENDDSAIDSILLALREDLIAVKKDFHAAAAALDSNLFQDAAHKTQSFIRIFNPVGYVIALRKVEVIYKEANWEKLSAANDHLIEELEQVISFLESLKEK